jgi:beta-glucosidase
MDDTTRALSDTTYDRFHGQRLLDELGVVAAFPHGFGLSYTTFSIDRATVEAAGDAEVRVAVTVTNSGDRDGHHVVQVYGRRGTGRYAGELMLVGFAGADVPAGASVSVSVSAFLSPLAEWDPAAKRRILPVPRDVVLEVGAHEHDPAAIVVRPLA